MKRKRLGGFFLCVALLLLAGHAVSGPVPDTGQAKCYDDSGEIPCPSPGQPFFGQDANYNTTPPIFYKIGRQREHLGGFRHFMGHGQGQCHRLDLGKQNR